MSQPRSSGMSFQRLVFTPSIWGVALGRGLRGRIRHRGLLYHRMPTSELSPSMNR